MFNLPKSSSLDISIVEFVEKDELLDDVVEDNNDLLSGDSWVLTAGVLNKVGILADGRASCVDVALLADVDVANVDVDDVDVADVDVDDVDVDDVDVANVDVDDVDVADVDVADVDVDDVDVADVDVADVDVDDVDVDDVNVTLLADVDVTVALEGHCPPCGVTLRIMWPVFFFLLAFLLQLVMIYIIILCNSIL